MISKYWSATTVLVALKLLLVPLYRSTDFEVHRNWLAITHSLPLKRWYYEDTSEWTLDYPPLFAWFEWCLSHIARSVDPQMVDVSNLEYASIGTIIFQRVSVIATDLVLILAAVYAARRTRSKANGLFAFLLIAANSGLLIVDHIHFQYNGFMLGILLWSILLTEAGHALLGGVLFAVLLNLKHLFAYAGPVYFVYLLRHYCYGPNFFARFLALGSSVAAVFAASFGPFVSAGQLSQVLKRLFPFGRGLTHSYWAANFWGLYSFGDKILAVALPKLGFDVQVPVAHLAGGHVGVSSFAVLPQIPPKVTMASVVVAMLPCLVQLWRQPKSGNLARAVAYANLCGFMFGYHVHEKAILTVILPMALYASETPRDATAFLLLSSAGHYALCPLLFQPQEYPIKLILVLLYCLLAWKGFAKTLPPLTAQQREEEEDTAGASASKKTLQRPERGAADEGAAEQGAALHLGWLPRTYLLGLLLLELFCSVVHPLLLAERLPFLPLMLTSGYCALAVSWVWLEQALRYCGLR